MGELTAGGGAGGGMAVCVDTMVPRYTAGPLTGLLLVASLYAPCGTKDKTKNTRLAFARLFVAK